MGKMKEIKEEGKKHKKKKEREVVGENVVKRKRLNGCSKQKENKGEKHRRLSEQSGHENKNQRTHGVVITLNLQNTSEYSDKIHAVFSAINNIQFQSPQVVINFN